MRKLVDSLAVIPMRAYIQRLPPFESFILRDDMALCVSLETAAHYDICHVILATINCTVIVHQQQPEPDAAFNVIVSDSTQASALGPVLSKAGHYSMRTYDVWGSSNLALLSGQGTLTLFIWRSKKTSEGSNAFIADLVLERASNDAVCFLPIQVARKLAFQPGHFNASSSSQSKLTLLSDVMYVKSSLLPARDVMDWDTSTASSPASLQTTPVDYMNEDIESSHISPSLLRMSQTMGISPHASYITAYPKHHKHTQPAFSLARSRDQWGVPVFRILRELEYHARSIVIIEALLYVHPHTHVIRFVCGTTIFRLQVERDIESVSGFRIAGRLENNAAPQHTLLNEALFSKSTLSTVVQCITDQCGDNVPVLHFSHLLNALPPIHLRRADHTIFDIPIHIVEQDDNDDDIIPVPSTGGFFDNVMNNNNM